MNWFWRLMAERRQQLLQAANDPPQVSTGTGNTGPVIAVEYNAPQPQHSINLSRVNAAPGLAAPGPMYRPGEANQHTYSWFKALRGN